MKEALKIKEDKIPLIGQFLKRVFTIFAYISKQNG